ncbi:MAG: T9SS type A sorting domain-containing protein [Bacteroidales bacterium]|nr:T9SS type A sorting domain-containing protein [Bacteroidales bacterium]
MKNLNNFLLALFTACFCYSYAQMDWVDFQNNGEGEQPPQMTMLNDSTIRVDFYGTNRSKKIIKDTIYDVLKFTGMNGKTIDIGLPELPLKACYLEVAVDTPNITIISEDFIILDDFYVMPAQYYKEPIEGDTIFQFIKNDSLYQSNGFYPSNNLSISSPKNLREHKISSLIFYPVQFNPVSSQLKVYKHIEVIIHGAGSIESEKDNAYFDSYLDGLIFNYETNNTPDEIIDLLIITPDEYYSSLLPFKDWKETVGIRTKIVTRDTIEEAGYPWMADPVGEDLVYQGIDDYIKHYYDAETELTPEFLLFVGEPGTLTPEMPTHYWLYFTNPPGQGSMSPTTDLYYTTMHISPDSDTLGIYDLPDMFSGRISVDNVSELEIVLNKIIEYEKSPYLDQTDWYNNINLSSYFEPYSEWLPDTTDCDCTENAYFLYTSYSIGEYLSQKNYTLSKVFVNNHLANYPNDILCWEWLEHLPPDIPFYLDEDDATNAVLQSINNGCFLVNHRDHGQSRNKYSYYHEGWSHPAFDSTHIGQLNNDKMLPVMFSINCQTGWFDGESDLHPNQQGNFDCFGELLLSAENGGVVGFIGSTRKSRSGYNDELCYGFYDAIWDDFDPYNNEIQTPIYKLGAIKDYGLFYMLNKFYLGNATTNYNYGVYDTTLKYNRKQVEEFHVLGDPTLEMWTGVPQPLYAYVDFDENSVTVYDENDQVIPEAKVVFQYGPEETEDYVVKMTDINGKVYSNLLNNFDVEVSALKHNYIPWYSTIISENNTWPADEDVRGNIIITGGNTLTFADDLVIPKYSRIIVMEGASLNVNENINLAFSNSYNDVLAYGNLYFAQNSTISTAGDGQEIANINLLNENLMYGFYNVNFNKCNIVGKPASLVLNQISLSYCNVEIEKGNVNAMGSDFIDSYLKVSSPQNNSSYVYITDDCTFTGTDDAIYIESYPNFRIIDNEISDCDNGIRLFNAGSVKGLKQISNNEIHTNNGIGILIYHSYVNIDLNNIYDNKFGIHCLDNSNISLKGNSSATIPEQTQQIADNSSNEVFATQGSFPFHFKWNAIIDDYNTDPLVNYKTTLPFEELIVSDNYWGTSFNPLQDLHPYEFYQYEPQWYLNGGGGGIGDGEGKYNDAQDKIAAEDYSGAKAVLQEIVIDYPTSKFAQAALRELFSMEEDAGDDYSSLKSYYDTETNIQNNPDLAKLADYLMNFCEIKLENWPTAIAWFEDVIQNPDAMEDSIFAIIDLGYTYFLMENGGLKSAYAGSMTEHIPQSVEQFQVKRDYLLSLLPGDQISESLQESLSLLKAGELLQNIPNPFKGTTEIWYKIGNDSNVEIVIFNNSGQIIHSFELGHHSKGKHFVEFDGSNLPDGIYYYSIYINGQTSDSKKMTIMK